MRKKLFLVLVIILDLTINCFAQNISSDFLDKIGTEILKTFNSLDLYLDESSLKISNTIVDTFSQQATSDKLNNIAKYPTTIDPFILTPILNDIRTSAPYLFDVAFISSQGNIIAIQPPFPGAIGTNVSLQEHFIRLINTRQPVLSKMFIAIEGFPSIVFQHPVISNQGILFGAVSILIKPKDMLKSIIDKQIKDSVVDVWIMQDDGTIIYDIDDEEIGKNLFTDSLYKPFKSLIDFGKQVATQESGSSFYYFYERGKNRVVKKYGQWITINIYGNKWKIVAISTKDRLDLPYRSLYEQRTKNKEEALSSLAKDNNLISAIKKGDQQTISEIFQNYLKLYPCYSVQWVDQNFVNRVGVPLGNMIENYDFSKNKSQRDIDFVKVISNKKETTFVAPLFEGGIAKFHMVPVFDKNNAYYGMIYDISL